MNRIFSLAVAITGALAAPAVALAQATVTVSGLLKGGFESSKLGNFSTLRAAGHNSQSGVVDDSSRIIFNVAEDLGGGLQAIGQYDFRGTLDLGALAASGNNHVGLRSKTWGRLFVGRQDLHYFNRESDLTVRGSLRADSISLLAFAGGGGTGIAVSTASNRTANVVHYTTPSWGGFRVIAAYSSNPFGQDADIGSVIRKGRAWNLNPNFEAANWQAGYSYWSAKQDGGVPFIPDSLGIGDQRGDRLYGSYSWGGLKIGLAWDKSRIKAVPGGGDLSRRTVWSIPVSYRWGAHSIHAHYDRAGDDKVMPGDEKARMFAISYAYDFSRRTSAAVTYARINNSTNAAYNFFNGTTLGVSAAPFAGEDPRLWGVTLRHQF
jgi:GBP family porin